MTRRTLARDGDRLLNRVFLDDKRVSRLLGLLDRDGESARVVGGAVRNALLGLPPGDVDIATTAEPDTVLARARAARLRSIPTGIDHGTVTVLVGGLPLEVTTLREDVETDGRRAVVRFGRDFAADAQRRDFTVNALSVNRDGLIYDYTGGVADLAAGRVRFIGDPVVRIREDYLRILRFFRFSALYALGELDPEGLAAAQAEVAGTDHLSRERVRAELLKLLSAPSAPPVVAAMAEAGVLDRIVGVPCLPDRYARYRAVEAARSPGPDPLLGLAALALADENDAQLLRDHLRLSNEERDRLTRVAAALRLCQTGIDPPDAHTISELLFAQGRQATIDALTLRQAESPVDPADPRWQAAARFAAIARVPSLPISGADIVARGVSRGPLVGQTLKAFQALWIRAGFPDTPAVLHELLDAAIAAARSNPS